jgi:hypothetical protein
MFKSYATLLWVVFALPSLGGVPVQISGDDSTITVSKTVFQGANVVDIDLMDHPLRGAGLLHVKGRSSPCALSSNILGVYTNSDQQWLEATQVGSSDELIFFQTAALNYQKVRIVLKSKLPHTASCVLTLGEGAYGSDIGTRMEDKSNDLSENLMGDDTHALIVPIIQKKPIVAVDRNVVFLTNLG